MQNQGVDILAEEQKLLKGEKLSSWWQKLKNTRAKQQGEQDFSHEVMDAMEGCLACKACAGQCPIKVDVPSFRARFLQLYHSRYLRPFKDYLVGSIERTAPLLAKAPSVVNFVIQQPMTEWVLKKTIGYVNTPLLSVPALHKRTTQFQRFDLSKLSLMSEQERSKVVLLVQDPFTSFYEAELVEDAMYLLENLGATPMLLPFMPNGKPQHVKGFLAEFAEVAKSASDLLNQIAKLNVTMVGLDASLVLVYRDEYKKALGENRGDFHVLLMHEWLSSQNLPTLKGMGTYQLLAHCTEKTALPVTEQTWQQIFAKAGLALAPVAVGCCGMAGTYGHEVQNQQNSRNLYDLSWQQVVNATPSGFLLATGFSCRSQVKRFEGFKPLHPLQLLRQLIAANKT
jgi:Fe-S oxidoreductase